jgi:hypothetical protein
MRSKEIACAVALLVLAGCGTPSTPKNSSGFGMVASTQPAAAARMITPETSNPDATFKGCWFTEGKKHYQGVDLSLGNPGTYPFNAYLYHGTTCNPDDIADQIGYGEEFDFGDFGWTFWFDRFANQKDMSAVWHVGSDRSVCVNYEKAPSC